MNQGFAIFNIVNNAQHKVGSSVFDIMYVVCSHHVVHFTICGAFDARWSFIMHCIQHSGTFGTTYVVCSTLCSVRV